MLSTLIKPQKNFIAVYTFGRAMPQSERFNSQQEAVEFMDRKSNDQSFRSFAIFDLTNERIVWRSTASYCTDDYLRAVLLTVETVSTTQYDFN
ncbi:hypothetical protein WBJ53_26615 [Spirosoma sp. SC4-14]|uniref:hypothetical protein n=1 Tax=Spirosoma sp. SC4-14 TaxID=3128900 RepID=UPI0030D54578